LLYFLTCFRSHSDDRSASICNGDSAVFSTSSSAKLYNISEEDEIRNGQVKFSIDDNSDDVFCTESPEVNTPEEIQETSFEIKNNISTIRTNNSDSNLEKMQLRVNHLWDQKLHLELSEHTNTNSEIGKMKKKRLQLSNSDTTHITRRRQDTDVERQINVTEPDNFPPCPIHKTQYNFPPSNTQDAVTKREKSTSKQRSYYSSSVRLKDNRVKSTIRRHALAQFKRHSTTVFDECAVEALSKEDLLVLWKRSEIELQTKLNKLQSQNNHLKCLLQIADSDDQEQSKSYAKKKPKLLCTKL